MFSSHCLHQDPHTHARVMQVNTAHGGFTTPCFMPVGTRAFVNLMSADMLEKAAVQVILGGNTYHMLCAPGLEIIQAAGGMHRMMAWPHPMLTDSGGFQVFSLSKNSDICKIDEDGARFKHPLNGQKIILNAETSIAAQKIIGADIIMAFDQCTPDQASLIEAEHIMARTHRWLLESKAHHDKQPNAAYGHQQALFGIIQGGTHQTLREQSTQFVVNAALDGIAIGGESIGFNMPMTEKIISWVRPLLPTHKLRYAMGVGLHPQDILDVVRCGVDIFDCVGPTRNARHGALYHGKVVPENNWFRFDCDGEARGQLSIKKACYAKDDKPVLTGCDCHTCQYHSRAYLHYLFKNDAPLYHLLACTHNIRVMQKTCEILSKHIAQQASFLI